MRFIIREWCLIVLLSAGWVVLMPVSAATQDVYPFASVQQETIFQNLTTQLRCLVCQNEDLADSNAGLAKDLRAQIYQMVRTGKSEQEIKQYMVVRYGDFILFKPPANSVTYLLWLGPLLLLAGGILVLLFIIRRRQRAAVTALTAEEERRVQQLLQNRSEL